MHGPVLRHDDGTLGNIVASDIRATSWWASWQTSRSRTIQSHALVDDGVHDRQRLANGIRDVAVNAGDFRFELPLEIGTVQHAVDQESQRDGRRVRSGEQQCTGISDDVGVCQRSSISVAFLECLCEKVVSELSR